MVLPDGAEQRDFEEDEMGYQLRGTYLTHCDCMQICPCSVDEKPTGRDGQCHGLVVVNIDNGSLDDTDLSGTKVVLSYSAPGKISDGGLRLGLVIDDAASDEQAAALERIFSGQVGGMFGEFTGLTERWIGTERAAIAFSDWPRARSHEANVCVSRTGSAGSSRPSADAARAALRRSERLSGA